MRTIYKYNLEVTDEQIISAPYFVAVLSVGVQNDKPVIWVIVDTENEQANYTVKIVTTGSDISDIKGRMTGVGNFDDWYYLGTFELNNGFVGHVFTRLI